MVVLEWHESQAFPVAVTGMCIAGLFTTPAYWPKWHDPQTLAVGTAAWLIVQVAKLVVLVWHVSQALPVVVTGICAAGLLTTPAYWPKWQVPQMLAVTVPAALWFMPAPRKLTVFLWHASQDAAVVIWLGGLVAPPGTVPVPPLLWQPPFVQAPAPTTIPAWLNVVIRKLVKLLALPVWQVSQEAAVTMWPNGFPKALTPSWQLPQTPAVVIPL